MTSTRWFVAAAVCAVTVLFTYSVVEQAYAGLPVSSTKKKSAISGSWSPSGFTCDVVDNDALTLNAETEEDGTATVTIDGAVECSTFGTGNTVDGQAEDGLPKSCTINVQHKGVNIGDCLQPGDAGFPAEAKGFDSFRPYTQTCGDISASDDITGEIECGAGAFSTCSSEGSDSGGINCGVAFGITPEQSDCNLIFGSGTGSPSENAVLLSAGIAYANDSNCGLPPSTELALETVKIDFEDVTDCDFPPVPLTEVTDSDGIASELSCRGGSADETCYSVGYGGMETSFVGKTVDSEGETICQGNNDNPEDIDPETCLSERVGRCGLTDEASGPSDSDDLYLSFSKAIKNFSADVIDYRADGGPTNIDSITLTVFGPEVSGVAARLGSSTYDLTGAEPDGNIETLVVFADNVRSAKIEASRGDVGVAYDNFRYGAAYLSQATTLVSRACASNDAELIGEVNGGPFNGGFLTDAEFGTENCRIALDENGNNTNAETAAEVEPEIQLPPAEYVQCSGSFTRNNCGANKPTITFAGDKDFLTGAQINKKSLAMTLEVGEEDKPVKFNCEAEDVLQVSNLSAERGADGTLDYTCRTTCDTKLYNAVKNEQTVSAMLTGSGQDGKPFAATCSFEVN